MALPPGVDIQHAQVATHGGEGEWFSYDGEIAFENVMVVDESANKVWQKSLANPAWLNIIVADSTRV